MTRADVDVLARFGFNSIRLPIVAGQSRRAAAFLGLAGA